MDRVITIVLRRDGRHLHTLVCSLEDAQRWVDEGYTVFRLATRGERWAVNHVNSGRVFADDDPRLLSGNSNDINHPLLSFKGD